MKKYFVLAVAMAISGASQASMGDRVISGNGITIKACGHDAGAICSLRWAGREFINDHDHGRQLQSAISYDRKGENYNPTEAGASYLTDGYNPRPSSSVQSVLLNFPDQLFTETRMAFWNPVNGQKTSGHVMRKHVTIGYRDMPNVIEYKTDFFAARDHSHDFVQYEVLTAYLPIAFSLFQKWDPRTGDLLPLSDGPGEQPLPVVMCTPARTHCMAIYNPHAPQEDYAEAGYGRWRHARDRVVKMNVVFRFNEANIDRSFTSYVVVGSEESVVDSLRKLHARLVTGDAQ